MRWTGDLGAYPQPINFNAVEVQLDYKWVINKRTVKFILPAYCVYTFYFNFIIEVEALQPHVFIFAIQFHKQKLSTLRISLKKPIS